MYITSILIIFLLILSIVLIGYMNIKFEAFNCGDSIIEYLRKYIFSLIKSVRIIYGNKNKWACRDKYF